MSLYDNEANGRPPRDVRLRCALRLLDAVGVVADLQRGDLVITHGSTTVTRVVNVDSWPEEWRRDFEEQNKLLAEAGDEALTPSEFLQCRYEDSLNGEAWAGSKVLVEYELAVRRALVREVVRSQKKQTKALRELTVALRGLNPAEARGESEASRELAKENERLRAELEDLKSRIQWPSAEFSELEN